MSQPLLKITDMAKSFSGVWALSNVQLTLEQGEIHALLGENGAGKSTLLKALSGAQPQTHGESGLTVKCWHWTTRQWNARTKALSPSIKKLTYCPT